MPSKTSNPGFGAPRALCSPFPAMAKTKKGNDKVDDIFKYQKKLTEVFIDGIEITMKDVVSSREFLRALRENSEHNISKLN